MAQKVYLQSQLSYVNTTSIIETYTEYMKYYPAGVEFQCHRLCI